MSAHYTEEQYGDPLSCDPPDTQRYIMKPSINFSTGWYIIDTDGPYALCTVFNRWDAAKIVQALNSTVDSGPHNV